MLSYINFQAGITVKELFELAAGGNVVEANLTT